jgi:hypothetical protein
MHARLLRRGVQAMYVPDAVVRHLVPLKRCSRAWVAERWLRTGIRDGLSYDGAGRRVAGMPVWALRQWLVSALALAATALAGAARRFAARVRFLECHGFLRGSRFARAGRRV